MGLDYFRSTGRRAFVEAQERRLRQDGATYPLGCFHNLAPITPLQRGEVDGVAVG
jgi:hypothetical protein